MSVGEDGEVSAPSKEKVGLKEPVLIVPREDRLSPERSALPGTFNVPKGLEAGIWLGFDGLSLERFGAKGEGWRDVDEEVGLRGVSMK